MEKPSKNKDELYEYDEFKMKEKTYLNLALTHKTRRRVNKECMERYLLDNKEEIVTIPMNKFNPKNWSVQQAIKDRVDREDVIKWSLEAPYSPLPQKQVQEHKIKVGRDFMDRKKLVLKLW